MSKRKIAVLGAGPMGLATAWQLVQDGYEPVIFEAGDRVGGMAASFDLDGLAIERYYHFHCTSDDGFFTLLEELGLSDKLKWSVTTMAYYFQGRVQKWGNPIALLTFRGLSFVAKFRYGLHVFLATKRRDWKPLDNQEASQWIKRWVGMEAWNALWQKLFDYKFYQYADNLSAAWIWSRLRRIGQSRYNLMKEKLGYLEGGSDTLLLALQEQLQAHGAELRLNCAAQRVVVEDGVLKGVETREGFETFDTVISTIPLPYLPKVLRDLPDDIVNGYRSVNNIAVVCITVKLAKALTPHFWLNVNDDEMDIPGVVEYTNLRPLGEGQHIVYVPYYVPGEHPVYADSDEVFIDKITGYFKRINPELQDSDFLSFHVHRYRYAQPICEPGFLERLPPVDLPVEGLWAADTSYYYPEDRGISESIDFGRDMARQATR
ncbi:protoporphyrinogen oxidase [Litorivivens lipolytica]|uniref:Protoporphyrinogen oxidase n=1 Tax=Litorivivens lipolytica TaxID=1524264 RepID=A0A7W4W6U0_9GAMM|nr:NAD(P)/FAD-dependent oxidoreductase [Litorivivens lipolytica]MBB3048504.1 protoporphyrinogen oxidase [Litorivivens lipolytica]